MKLTSRLRWAYDMLSHESIANVRPKHCAENISFARFYRNVENYFRRVGWSVEEGGHGGNFAVGKNNRYFHLQLVAEEVRATPVFLQDCVRTMHKVPLPLVIVSAYRLPERVVSEAEERGIFTLHYLDLPFLVSDEGRQMIESAKFKSATPVRYIPAGFTSPEPPKIGDLPVSERPSLFKAVEKYSSRQHKIPDLLEELCRLRKFDDAFALAEVACIAFPTNLKIHIASAVIPLASGDLPLASKLLYECRIRFPKSADAVGFGGAVLRRQNKLVEAEALLKDGEARFPLSWRISAELAECASSRSAGPEAVAKWADFNKSFPNRPEGYWRLAHELLRTGDIDRAQVVIHEGLLNFPAHPHVLWQYAAVATRRRDWVEAESRWQAGLKLFPNMRELVFGYEEMKLAVSSCGHVSP